MKFETENLTFSLTANSPSSVDLVMMDSYGASAGTLSLEEAVEVSNQLRRYVTVMATGPRVRIDKIRQRVWEDPEAV